MLVIPVTDGLKKKFPVISLILILLNGFVFFGFQLNEDEGYLDALSFARTSGLLKIEAKVYTGFLDSNGQELPVRLQGTGLSDGFFWHMLQDDEFQYQLRAHTLIMSTDSEFVHWLELRQIFEDDLNKVFSWRYGYSPARRNYIGLLTCMFLHGGIMHLLGNMVFLWFVGSLLEIGVGRIPYLLGYLFTGVCASLAFGLAYPMSQGPLVGASGAIAGLMGAYGLIYGRARIKVFYSFGFYFDYARVPGWFLFPFWLGNEFLQLYTNEGSNVAYMAHIGGLVSGASLAMLYLTKRGSDATSVLAEEENQTRVPELVEEGLQFFAELKLDEARGKMIDVLDIDPANKVALIHLFNIDKCTPKSPLFHESAGLLLGYLAKTKGRTEIEKYFEEYAKLSGGPMVGSDVLLAVTASYLRSKKSAPAAQHLSVLLKQYPQVLGIPVCLFDLAQLYLSEEKQKQATQCLNILKSHYAESNYGRKAKALLAS